MPKGERTTTEKVALGFFGALAAVGAFFGIRYFVKGAPPGLKGKLSKGGIYVI